MSIVVKSNICVTVGTSAKEAMVAAEDLEDETVLLTSDTDSITHKIEDELKPALRKLTTEGEESISDVETKSMTCLQVF